MLFYVTVGVILRNSGRYFSLSKKINIFFFIFRFLFENLLVWQKHRLCRGVYSSDVAETKKFETETDTEIR